MYEVKIEQNLNLICVEFIEDPNGVVSWVVRGRYYPN